MVLPLAGLRVNLWSFLYKLQLRYDRPDCLVPGHVGVPAGVGRSLPAQVPATGLRPRSREAHGWEGLGPAEGTAQG